MLEKIVKKVKKIFSSKMFLIHPSWSTAVPKHPPGPRQSFSTILHPQNKFQNFFEKSKFRPQNPFLEGWLPHELEKRVWEVHEKANLFFNFDLQVKLDQGSKVWDHIQLSVIRICDTRLTFEKNHFLTPSCEQTFKNMLKTSIFQAFLACF